MWPNGFSANDTGSYTTSAGTVWNIITQMKYENGEWIMVQNNIKKPTPKDGKQYLFDFMEMKTNWMFA